MAIRLKCNVHISMCAQIIRTVATIAAVTGATGLRKEVI